MINPTIDKKFPQQKVPYEQKQKAELQTQTMQLLKKEMKAKMQKK